MTSEQRLADMTPEERSELLANYSEAAGEVAHRLAVLAQLRDADLAEGERRGRIDALEEVNALLRKQPSNRAVIHVLGTVRHRLAELKEDAS